jgi:hypothetical protein
MIWRIVHLVKNAKADFVYNMPALALTTTLELWLCIIIGCIPTLAPIFRIYISPIVAKVSGSRKTASNGSTSRHIVTFGGGRGPRPSSYITMVGSEDAINANEDITGREAKNDMFRDDEFTTTLISSKPRAEDMELETISTKHAIRVQQDVQTRFSA